MVPLGTKAMDFNLPGVDSKEYSLASFSNNPVLAIIFMCNHCPYVKAVIEDIVNDCKSLEKDGLKSLAIMSNDTKNYPEDSFENMISFSKKHRFEFPYLIDENQEVAKKYGAVCTPDFFGYNSKLELQYRGRIRELKDLKPIKDSESDLLKAMRLVIETGKGPKDQIPSMGCNIKWVK